MAEEADLEAIRARRLAELQAQHGEVSKFDQVCTNLQDLTPKKDRSNASHQEEKKR